MRTLVFLLLLLFTNNVLAMAKTLIWECQVIKVNNDKQINGKVNKYKIDVTTPMVWVGDETRWSSFANTTFSYDRDDHSLFSSSKMWDGVYDLIERKIIFINNDANLKILYQCEEL